MKMLKTLPLLFLATTVAVVAQNQNPYAELGYEAPIMEMEQQKKATPSTLVIFNQDTGSVARILVIDIDRQALAFYDKHDKLIETRALDRTEVARWLTIDPVRQYASPYVGMGNDPVNRVDADGGVDNPIYDPNGNFMGTDDRGLQGEAIIMDAASFTQGMAHSDALSAGTLFSHFSGSQSVADAIAAHFAGLPSRPDWDGFMTISEGIQWAKDHPDALANPTPDNSVYINIATLNFRNISTADLPLGKVTAVNLF